MNATADYHSASDYEAQHSWLERWFRPWAVAVLMGCLAQGVAELLGLFYPATVKAYLVLTAVLGALLGYGVYRLSMTTIPSDSERRSLRRLVLAIAFFGLKALSFLVEAFTAVQATARLGTSGNALAALWQFLGAWSAELGRVIAAHLAAWAVDPRAFFDVTTLVGFASFMLSWGVALTTANDFARIGVPSEDRQERLPLAAISRRFLTGGVLLLIVTGLARTEMWDMAFAARPPLPGLLVNVLLYTILGFALVAHTHLLTRIRRWQSEKAHIADDLAARWLRYAVVFMAAAAILAAVLPTGFTVPLLDWGRWFLWGLMLVGTFLFYLLGLLFWPLGWLLSLLFKTPPPDPPELQLQSPPAEFAAEDAAAETAPQFLVLRTLIVLTLLIGGLLFWIRRYLQAHPEVRARLAAWRPVLAARQWGMNAARWLRGLFRRAHSQLRQGLRNSRLAGMRLPSLPRARRLRTPETPREQVMVAYLTTLETAGDSGVSRRASQTPDEYQNILAVELPDVQGNVSDLTEIFDEARYSRHVLTSADAERAQRHAQAIAAALERERSAEQA